MEGNDVALIKLDRACDSPLTNLDTQGSLHAWGNTFAALGWGSDSSGRLARLLQLADRLSFVAGDLCNEKRHWDGQIKNSMICAGTGKQDTMQGSPFHREIKALLIMSALIGDSGGPLLKLDRIEGNHTLGDPSSDLLVGITSFGYDWSKTSTPGVYTRIAYFRNWIDCIIANTVCAAFLVSLTPILPHCVTTTHLCFDRHGVRVIEGGRMKVQMPESSHRIQHALTFRFL